VAKASAIIDLIANDKRFRKAMTGIQGLMGKVKASMEAVSRAARRTLLVGAAAIAGFLRLQSLQIKAETKLAAVLKATGGAAGLSAEQLNKYAAELQAATGVGDELIINMQAVLATFRNIKGDVFKDATKAIVDMAAVLDTDLKSAAIQVGKALNDPIRGVSMLTRVGITFTDQQTDMIKSFVEMGDTVSAQNVVLTELQMQFDGVAEALGKTLPGQALKAKSALGDLGEKIGAVFTPAAIKLFKAIVKLSRRSSRWVTDNAKLIVSLTATTATIAIVAVAIPILAGTIAVLSKSLVILQATLLLTRAKLAALPALITAINASIVAAAAAVGLLVIQYGRMRSEIKAIRKSLGEATTSLNEASTAGRELKEALEIEDFGTALEASKRKTEALKNAVRGLTAQVAELEEGGTSFVFGDENQEALLRNTRQQIRRLNRQIEDSADEEKRVNDLLVSRLRLEKEIADKKATSAAAEAKFIADNAVAVEGIRKTNQEIAVLKGEITQQQADFNDLFSQGVNAALAAALIEAKTVKAKIVAQQAEKKATKDKQQAIQKSMRAEAAAIRESLLTDKQRLANDIARVKLLEQQGFLTRQETAEKIKQLKAQTEINNQTGKVLSAQALFSRIQESAGSRFAPGGTQAILQQLTNHIQAATRESQNNKRLVTGSVDRFRESFEQVAEDATLVGRFGT